MADAIFRVWAESEKTPNPIQKTYLDEEVVCSIIDNGFLVNYFFMDTELAKIYFAVEEEAHG